MKKLLIFLLLTSLASSLHAQKDKYWSRHSPSSSKLIIDKSVLRASFPKEFKLFDLNLSSIKQTLFSIVGKDAKRHSTIITLPNAEGQIEEFEVFEASNFEPDLQEKFPNIRAFSGKGITDKFAILKLSISPDGIQTMLFRTDRDNEFIETYSEDHVVYAVFKSQRDKGKLGWTCSTQDKKLANDVHSKVSNYKKNSDGKLRVMRLAQSCTAEYSNYFNATSAAQVDLVLAALNNTLTRCNGVYEKDLALHLNLVSASTNVIFYDPATDPYSPGSTGAGGAWNTELQNTLSSRLTGPGTTLAANNAAYDIGHLFGASGGGGSAGCIGCVCEDDTSSAKDENKGSGFTSPSDGVPKGDSFDIDYVAHEVGHQLGGTHTFSNGNEGAGVSKEVGSGVTIMGYAGITSEDFARNSIDIFHETSIEQIQLNLSTKTCPVTTNISANNATPVVNAGLDYTIPISTPFALTGSATDANTSDVLTYCWEQNDDGGSQTGTNSLARENKPSGPNWRSFSATASPVRYFPILESILANSRTTTGVTTPETLTAQKSEALSSVARTLNFRLTVRDNVPYSSTAPIKVGQTNFDDMKVTVNAASGPFTVTSQNTAGITYTAGSTQTITWNVANTTASPVSTANVKISLSKDGGLKFDTVLVASTPNDGTQTVTIPTGINSTNCRIKVEAIGNIFFNVNTTKFTINSALGNTDFQFEEFSLFPIPNNGNFNLKLSSSTNENIKVSVFDLGGREVYSKSFSNTGTFNQNINLNKVQTGVYLVSVSDGVKKTVKQIVVE
jgi:hypothetical protein